MRTTLTEEPYIPPQPSALNRFALAAALMLTLSLSAVAQTPASPVKACGDIMANGQTFQQKADAVLTEGAEDPAMAAPLRAHLRLTEAEFDNLCAIDAELGTREAGTFFNEEADRQGRLAVAMHAKRP
jgi:hypothetical protein